MLLPLSRVRSIRRQLAIDDLAPFLRRDYLVLLRNHYLVVLANTPHLPADLRRKYRRQ